MQNLVENGQDLTIVGVVQPKEDSMVAMLSSGIKYDSELPLYVMEQARDSDVVKAQMASPDTNIFTGKAFGEESSALDLANFFTVDIDALSQAFSFDTSMFDASSLTSRLSSIDLSSYMNADIGNFVSSDELQNAMPSLSDEDIEKLLSSIKITASAEELKTLFTDVVNGYLAYASGDPSTDYANIDTAVSEYMQSEDAQNIIRSWFNGVLQANAGNLITAEQLQSMMEAFLLDFQAYAGEQGMTDPDQMAQYLRSYVQTDRAQALLQSDIEQITSSLSNIQVTDEQIRTLATDLSDGYTAYAQANGKPDPGKFSASFSSYLSSSEGQALILSGIRNSIDTSGLQQEIADMTASSMNTILSEVESQVNAAVQTVTASLAEQISAALQDSLSSMGDLTDLFDVDTANLSDFIKTNMSDSEIRKLLSSLLTSGTSDSYENNLSELGYADEGDPSAILIYPNDFDSKDKIMQIIAQYNTDVTEAGEEEKTISYSDMIGALIATVTNIVNTISTVLIAFVAISLVVSSIMIGVITYISVLERRKEIGILRALGASKRNISEVFNAETFIIGLLAGLIGIGLTMALIPVVDYVIRRIVDVEDIAARLPVHSALLLIGLSVLLTVLSGLLPSRKAAKSDPVTALRTE